MEPGGADGEWANDDVFLAEGLVALQMNVGIDQAAEALRQHSVEIGRPLATVAGEVCAGRLTFGTG